MKFSHALSLLLLAAPLAAFHANAGAQNVYGQSDELIPAGSLLHCTLDEKLSSKTVAVGDPIICQVGHAEVFGRSTIPYGSYLIGRFADYKDPGHFVGKGWVELKFDRLVIKPDTILPVNARVIEVPKYPVDQDGRIHGTGHTGRDIVEWSIPLLWPIDLIELPRRGPRVVLKPETQLTLRVMDDLGIPTAQDQGYGNHQPALISRQQPSSGYNDQYQQPQQQYAPQQPQYAPQQPVYQSYAPQQQAPQTVIYNNYAPPQQQQYIPQQQQQTVVVQAPPQPRYVAPRPVYVQPPPPPYAYAPYGYRYYAPY